MADSFWYAAKRHLLGAPLVNEQLATERLSKPMALGILSCDGISSAAYGTEMMLLVLLPFFGLAAFSLILPLTLVILVGIFLVMLSYREVVSVYIRAGGSYIVARENFGPRVAQVAAVALLIDYVVTLAVQTAAGSAAIVSAFPSLTRLSVIGPKILLVISAAAILLMCFCNLRGIREAGRAFALPTYLFSGSVVLMIVMGLYREVVGDGLPHVATGAGTVALGSHANTGLIVFGAIYILARAFANGGSSLTGIEAVSNAVSALQPPEGRNAREILVAQGSIVAFLIAGISWLAHVTHAMPYTAGVPTVLAQEARAIFGSSVLGQVLFFTVQAGTAAILFTGGNTSFSGFPFLASFVAEDGFLPRWLSKRGHRLVFSNGILILAAVSLTLLLAVGATVGALIPFYAIGVFTGFSIAGFGRESDVLDNLDGTDVHVTTGTSPQRSVILFVDRYDLATIAALRYARSLRPASLRAIHLTIDQAHAKRLADRWLSAGAGIPLELVDCPDRRLAHTAADLVAEETKDETRHVTAVLPRRSYAALTGRLLHDRTADKMAHAISHVPSAIATIIPFDVRHKTERLHTALSTYADTARPVTLVRPVIAARPVIAGSADRFCANQRPVAPTDAEPIGRLIPSDRATVEGEVHTLQIQPVDHSSVLCCQVGDGTGELTALFYGRRHIAGIQPGCRIRLHGTVGRQSDGRLTMVNPTYELMTASV
jgi:amino acid transporter